MSKKKIGILALQGAFESHREKISALGGSALLVRTTTELDAISALIFPGGESSTMLKLMSPEMKQALSEFFKRDRPVFATCAGAILLAKGVSNPEQPSFSALDIDVIRNGYGRQVDSFVSPEISLTREGRDLLGDHAVEGVFIRAPIISRTGSTVRVLAVEGNHPVLVQSGNCLAATFHPELSEGESVLHRYFLSLL